MSLVIWTGVLTPRVVIEMIDDDGEGDEEVGENGLALITGSRGATVGLSLGKLAPASPDWAVLPSFAACPLLLCWSRGSSREEGG